MTPGEIRGLFPGTRNRAYFNAASASLLPVPVMEAMREVTAGWVDRGILNWADDMKRVEATRVAAADLVGSAPDEIAFTANTAEGIARIAAGFPFEPGDEVVLSDLEYPANVYPWAIQQDRGVRLRIVRSQAGRIDTGRLVEALGPRTRVLALSMVQFASGFRSDLESVGRECMRRGVLLAVDAIQGLGVFPVNVRSSGIGALVADGRKWLMGPAGAGFLFVDREWVPRIRPCAAGALSVRNSHEFMQYLERFDAEGRLDLDGIFREGAGRYEAGYYNVAGLAGLGAALRLASRIGRERIRSTVESLVARLLDGLAARGIPVHGPRAPAERSGIVSFSLRSDAGEAVRELERRGFSLGARDGRLRAAPHVYNSEEEIDALLAELDSIGQSS